MPARLAESRVAPLWRELWGGRPGPRSGQIRDLQGSRAATCSVDSFSPLTTEGMDQRVLEPQLHCWALDTRILSGAGVYMQAQAKAKEDS